MAANLELPEFVRDALARGLSRHEIQDALLRAGWSRDMVDTALGSLADVDFPLPVPRPKSYLSAREAFLYLLLFSTLYICAYNAGVIAFSYIDRWFPDAAMRTYNVYVVQAVRWALSSLVVAFPVFLFLSRIVERSVRLDPGKRRSHVRRWLMYLTVFIAATVLIGDFITLVYNALGGELSTRFVLKVCTIGIIAGTVLTYYMVDLRLDETKSAADGTRLQRVVTAFAWVSAAALMIGGLVMIGSPAEERARRLDERRVEDLQDISQRVQVYFDRQKALPGSLEELSREGGMSINASDPGGVTYEYRVTGANAYELCATFERESRSGRGPVFWSHDAGRRCFPLELKEERSAQSRR